MKKILLASLILSATNIEAQTSYPGNIPGCVARYDFRNDTVIGGTTLRDVSGNGNHGVMHSLAATAGWRGEVNGARKFDGSSSFVQVANSATLTPQVITMLALVKFDGFYNGTCQINQIVAKGTNGGYSGYYSLEVADQLYDQNCNQYNPNQEMPEGFLGQAAYSSVPPTPPVQIGKWYFLALTYDGSIATCYQAIMDSTTGRPTVITPNWAVTTTGGLLGSNTNDLTIGNTLNSQYPYWFNGTMDEVAIFNRPLTNAEVLSAYQYLWGNSLAVNDVSMREAGIKCHISNGLLQLNTIDGDGIGEVTMYNMAGQKLTAGHYTSHAATIDVTALPKEMLFIKVARKGAVATLKAVNL